MRLEEATVALLKANGFDPSTVTAVRYTHRVGEMPRLEVESAVFNPELGEFDDWVIEWQPVASVDARRAERREPIR